MLAAYTLKTKTNKQLLKSPECIALFQQVVERRDQLVKSLNFSVKVMIVF
jgi:hypothetical protein